MESKMKENSEIQNLTKQVKFYRKESENEKNKNRELKKEMYLLKGSSIYDL